MAALDLSVVGGAIERCIAPGAERLSGAAIGFKETSS